MRRAGSAERRTPLRLRNAFTGRWCSTLLAWAAMQGVLPTKSSPHIAGLVGSVVTVTLEIDAELPEGVPEKVVHVVTEERSTAEIPQSGLRV